MTAERAEKLVRHASLILHHVKDDRARFHLRLQIFMAYGARCVCCGEMNVEKLTLNHVAPLKEKNRKAPYQQAIARNYPATFQVLCRLCNSLEGTAAMCLCGGIGKKPAQASAQATPTETPSLSPQTTTRRKIVRLVRRA